MSETLQAFNEAGVVFMWSASGWTGRDRLTAHDLGKETEDIPDIFTLGNKKLLDKETEAMFNRSQGQIQSLMDSCFAKPFLNGRAMRFVTMTRLIQAQEGMNIIKQKQTEAVEAWLPGYDGYKAQRIEEYPELADARWPNAEQILKRFDVKWVVFRISNLEIEELDPQELIDAKKQAQQNLASAYEDMADVILRDVQVAILQACQELHAKVIGGERVTLSTLKKPRKVIEDYLNVADLFDLKDVKARVLELRDVIDSTDTAEVRANFRVAEEFAQALKSLGDNIGDLSGLSADGTVKRVVKIAKEEEDEIQMDN
ncbi:MAG: DUF3150 domain-containing protein [Pseudomonadota bacterium]